MTPVCVDKLTSLSLRDLERSPGEFALALGKSFEVHGFAILADHGIGSALAEEAEAMMRALFALPETVKAGYRIHGGGGARGYTPFGIETAKGSRSHDLKEFWHIGREVPEGHPLKASLPDNVWPAEIPGFRSTFLRLYQAFDELGVRILRAIAIHLGVRPGFLSDAARDGNSVLRLLHYPPVQGPAGDHIRAAAHEDINAITLLLGAEEAGLELMTRDGRWMPVRPRAGEMVINIGDMLQRLTNGKLRSTSHRVVNPSPGRARHSRYSMLFFLHFRPDFLITALPQTVPAGEEPKWPSITADDFLKERLKEIRLA